MGDKTSGDTGFELFFSLLVCVSAVYKFKLCSNPLTLELFSFPIISARASPICEMNSVFGTSTRNRELSALSELDLEGNTFSSVLDSIDLVDVEK